MRHGIFTRCGIFTRRDISMRRDFGLTCMRNLNVFMVMYKDYLHKRVPCVDVTHVATPCITIPCMVQDYMRRVRTFHAMRKRGPRKHITGILCRFLVALCVEMCVIMKL